MRKIEEKEFKLGKGDDAETIKVIHTRLQPRAALKLGMKLLRVTAPLLTDVDTEKMKLEDIVKTLPLALSALDDENLIDELLIKIFSTTLVMRDADGKPVKCECTTGAQIDKAFDDALPTLFEVARWIIEANLRNFSFATAQKESPASS